MESANCMYPDCQIKTDFGEACEHSCPHEYRQKDKYFRDRLLRDFDRLIDDFHQGILRSGITFGMWLTPMDGKLILAALRAARERATPPLVDPRADAEPTICNDANSIEAGRPNSGLDSRDGGQS